MGHAALLADPHMTDALRELELMIRRRYPDATFAVSHGEGPEGVYLTPTVDVPDTEAVFDLVIDRLLQFQIEEQLPIYAIPVRPLARVVEELRSQRMLRSTLDRSWRDY